MEENYCSEEESHYLDSEKPHVEFQKKSNHKILKSFILISSGILAGLALFHFRKFRAKKENYLEGKKRKSSSEKLKKFFQEK